MLRDYYLKKNVKTSKVLNNYLLSKRGRYYVIKNVGAIQKSSGECMRGELQVPVHQLRYVSSFSPKNAAKGLTLCSCTKRQI